MKTFPNQISKLMLNKKEQKNHGEALGLRPKDSSGNESEPYTWRKIATPRGGMPIGYDVKEAKKKIRPKAKPKVGDKVIY